MKPEEHLRLEETASSPVPQWQKWGPYVAERAWGTVREDYSSNGDFWNYLSHHQAISKAYRWGEDGIAGWCDRYQILVFSPAFWNGEDPILKERLFGLSPHEGNHGEDVKENYYYLDGTPSHSYMKYLYKYPQREFPYQKLVEENKKRTSSDPEYELIDTGIFSENRYFDIFIEYAKASPEDICIRIQAFNRADVDASLHILPQLVFRNQWSWGDVKLREPLIKKGKETDTFIGIETDDSMMLSPSNLAFDYHLGKRYLYGPKGGNRLFTNNETHFSGQELPKNYYKDAFHRRIVNKEDAVNPLETGTKACFEYAFKKIPAGKGITLYLRLTDRPMEDPLKDVPECIDKRKKEADQFYKAVHPKNATDEEKSIQRQALAGILWNKQIYLYDVNLWLKGDNPKAPPPDSRLGIRNVHWRHLNSMRILLMPDKWENPYFCAWDQAFHTLSLALVDLEAAKEQLWLLLFDQFQHPNGQIPSSEEEFSNLNPPIQAWAALRLYDMEKERNGKQDYEFLQRCFHKLIINFSWWVTKVDSSGFNVFEGGFLGLDNITIIDRSKPIFQGGKLQQSDGTGWMAMFCLNLMRIALELSRVNHVYESLATKFFQHYAYIADAMKKRDNQGYEIWSEKDSFFYDVLCYPDGRFQKFRVRSLVGIIPLYAAEFFEEEELKQFPEFYRDFKWFLKNREKIVSQCLIPLEKKGKKSYVFTVMTQPHLQNVLKYIWDPKEFRSDFGLRSLSKIHLTNPFAFDGNEIRYEPGHSLEKINGGNSNWRGPVWFPTTFLLIDALKKLAKGLDDLSIQVGEEKPVTLNEMAASFTERLISLFLNKNGTRPYLGDFPFKQDPYWKEHHLFYDFFHGDTGKGLGASHQTGWTALIANLIDELRT
ncbi:MAG TPA: glucosidase [Rhabdochlamydiaceae bacterium]|nr:glucosidase [Rhabdochlamydiaceae bacterium]